MRKIPVAVQLYSVREDIEKDFFGTLAKVRELGYDGVEFAGFGGHSAPKVKAFLDTIGLKAVSSHVPIDSFLADPTGVLNYHETMQIKYIAVPWLDEPRRPGTPQWPTVVEQIRKFAKQCQNSGIQLLYHNHDFEFTKLNGRHALDLLYEDIPMPLLASELDTCWVKVSGVDPAEYLLRFKGRAPVVHLKDFVLAGDAVGKPLYALIDESGKDNSAAVADSSTFDFRPLGMGVQDIPSILRAAQLAGTEWVVVEQDRSSGQTPMEAIWQSRHYLRTLGY